MVEDILAIFPEAKIHSGYALVRCPYHANGEEHTPSMSILLEARGKARPGLCHCFACNKVTTFEQMLQDLGYGIQKIDYTDTQKQRFKQLKCDEAIYKPELPFRASKYLENRGISKNTQELFKIYEKDDKVNMPVFNKEGKYLYVNARSTTSKQFFIQAGAEKTLWGIEEIDFRKPIAVCESQIDALSFWEVGCQAVATLGAGNIGTLQLLKDAQNLIILAFDPDIAGRQAREKAAQLLGRFRCRYIDLPEGVDINQALQDIQDKQKFLAFIKKNVKKFRT